MKRISECGWRRIPEHRIRLRQFPTNELTSVSRDYRLTASVPDD
jgi:hypothetical protein